MKRTKAYGLLAVAVLSLGAAACGGDDETAGDGGEAAADGPLVDALAANILEEGDSPVANEEEAQCWASGVVGGIGEDRLEELGVTPESVGDISDLALTDDEVSVVVDSMFGCTDVQAAFASQFAADFGDEVANCIASELDEDLVKQALSASLAGSGEEPSPEFMEAFTKIATDCGIED